MSDSKLRIKNIFFLFNQNVIRLIISLFVGIYVARYLGTEDYGRFNFVISFLFLYKPLISFGVDEFLLSKINNSEDILSLFGTSFILRIFSFLVFYLASIYLMDLFSVDELSKRLSLLYLFSLITVPFGVCEAYLSSQLNVKSQATFRTLIFIVLALMKLLFIYFKMPLSYFIYISMSEIVLLTFVSVFIFQAHYKNISIKFWKFDKNLFKEMFLESLPILFSILVFRGMSKVDQLFIANYGNMHELGLYGAAAKLIEQWLFLPTILSQIYLPQFSKSEKSVDEYFAFLSLSSILLFVSCYFLGDYIINIFYGDKFFGATDFLTWYSLQFIFTFFAIGRINAMTSFDRSRTNLILTTFIFVLNIIGNFYFIKVYGSIGVIWASIASNFVGFFIFYLINKDIRSLINRYLLSGPKYFRYLFTR